MTIADWEEIRSEIDALSPASFAELRTFIAFLRYREGQKGSPWVKELYDSFAPVREAVAQSGMTDTEIDDVLNRAIDEVRRERRG